MEKSIKTCSTVGIVILCFLCSAGCSKISVSKPEAGYGNVVNSQPGPQYAVTTVVDHIPSPQGLTVDGEGNLYITSSGNAAILKISPSGSMSTLSIDRSFGASVIGAPAGIINDAQGNLYFTDVSNDVIGRIAPSGLMNTIAGDNATGNADGVGGSAQFNDPYGITIDRQGNLYVTDAGNAAIRKITAAGSVTTLVATSPGNNPGGKIISPGLGRPQGITIDDQGNLYVTDVDHAAILKITSSGIITTIAGGQVVGYADGTGMSAQFNKPMGITIDGQGNLFVADAANAAIREITPSGLVTTIAGGKTIGLADGIGVAAEFDSPEGIAIDSQGNLYVSDGCYGAIRKITLQ
jgi:sugar lactone lactonase YvrE